MVQAPPDVYGTGRGERIRTATGADVPTLTEIAHEAKRHWRYPEHWIRGWDHLLTIAPEDLESLHILVAASHGHIAGFCAVECDDGGWSVAHLWVRPPCMGRGIGRALMERAADHVRRHGGTTLVIESDPHAEGFYRRLGARRIGRVPAHVGTTKRYLPLLELSIR